MSAPRNPAARCAALGAARRASWTLRVPAAKTDQDPASLGQASPASVPPHNAARRSGGRGRGCWETRTWHAPAQSRCCVPLALRRSAPPLLARPVPHGTCDSMQPFRGEHSCHQRGGRARFRERPAPGRTPPSTLGGCPDGTCRAPPHCLRAPARDEHVGRGRPRDAGRCPGKDGRGSRTPSRGRRRSHPHALVCNDVQPAGKPVTHARLASGAEIGPLPRIRRG
jgi:hypothetical protein